MKSTTLELKRKRFRLYGPVFALLLVTCTVSPPGGTAAEIREGPGTLTLENDHYRIKMKTEWGLAWVSLENRAIAPDATPSFLSADIGSRIFEVVLVESDAKYRLSSADFNVTEVVTEVGEQKRAALLKLYPAEDRLPLTAELKIEIDDSPQSLWTFRCEYPRDATLDWTFPILEEMQLGEPLEDTWYFSPREPGLMNNAPIRLLTNYGQYAQTQLACVFNNNWGSSGGGLYYFIKDTSMRRRSFELRKTSPGESLPITLEDRYGFPFWEKFREKSQGVSLATHSPRILLEANEKMEMAPVAIGIHLGNWRKAFDAYRRWVDEWMQTERNPQFAEVFVFHSFDLFSKTSPDDALQAVPDGVDMLHFMVQKEHVNGEYGYRDDWGLEGLRKFTQGVQNKDILISHYLEGYIASEKSVVFLEHGDDWGQKQADGTNLTAFANMCMSLAAPGWRQFLVDTASRLVKDLDFNVIYLDEIGFGTGDKYLCYNPNVEKPPPFLGMTSVREILREVHASIRKIRLGTCLTTEGPVVDLWYPYLDGNEGYAVRQYQIEGYAPPVNFMRFLFPEFKFINLRHGTDAEQQRQLKQILFNGDAALIEPERTERYDGEATRLFQECRDAFTDPKPDPLLETRQPGLYCNRFQSDTKTVYTLWNDNDYPVGGTLLPVQLGPGSHLVDLVENVEIQTTDVRQVPHLVASIPPKDLAIVCLCPKAVSFSLEGVYLFPQWDYAQGALHAVGIDQQTGREVRRIQLSEDQGLFNLVDLTQQDANRVVLKLLDEKGRLVDQSSVTPLGQIDLAPFAKVAASNATARDDNDPRTVIEGKGTGKWEFRHDDQPRPGWLELTWERPQTFNSLKMRFSRKEYSPRDYQIQTSNDGKVWDPILSNNASNFATSDSFPPLTTRYVRIVFHQGGSWGNLVSLERLHLCFENSR